MIRPCLVLTGLLVLSGCSAFLATSQDLYYHDETFAPRRAAEAVEVFAEERPRTPYIVLGRVVATQGMFGSRESILAEIRRKAAAMGGDAVIDLQESSARSTSQDAPSQRTHFEQEGDVSTSETWVPESRSSIRLTVSGLAIRFQSADSPQVE
ncbi:hypothetical protein D3C86_442970 [compost metagenome]